MSRDWVDSGRNRQVLTVSQLTRKVRSTLEGQFSKVWIEGEISNYRPHGSGHHYFTLKDEGAQISCVLFRGQARHLNFRLSDGQRVQARGDVSVYEARGQYQLIVQWLQPQGIGDLQARFEELKRKLDAEGLFAPERKRPLPSFPRTIAVVTSPTGAAIRDILNVLKRRAPWINVIVFPVAVQGAGAENGIAAAIRTLSTHGEIRDRIDTVIVGRGGGSLEDLWNFNEEIVARAIDECPIPVISAVGHEIDFTIADFVADLRAPTPSAAAELAVPDGMELRERLRESERRLEGRAESVLEALSQRLSLTRRTLMAHEPRSAVENANQRIDHLADRMEGVLVGSLDRERLMLVQAGRLVESWDPDPLLSRLREQLQVAGRRLDSTLSGRQGEMVERLARLGDSLRTLSPEGVLRRGFSMTLDGDGNAITNVEQVKEGDRVRTRLAAGEFVSVVESGAEKDPEGA